MTRRPPGSKRTAPLFPYTTLCRSAEMAAAEAAGLGIGGIAGRVAAPALGRMTDIGRRALEFARQGGEELGASSRVLTGGSRGLPIRSEEHTSELQSLMRISYAVFCLKKKKDTQKTNNETKTT